MSRSARTRRRELRADLIGWALLLAMAALGYMLTYGPWAWPW
jgi:hypothetical protein